MAAWINAETGVGPSIASGNQVCKPIWADLADAAIIKHSKIISVDKKVYPKILTVAGTKKTKPTSHNKEKETVFQEEYEAAIAIKNAKSPTLLTKTALKADLLAWILVNQKLIKKKEDNPTPSQPINAVIKSSDIKKTAIKTLKNKMWAIKTRLRGSVVIYSNEKKITNIVILKTTQNIKSCIIPSRKVIITAPLPKLNHNQLKWVAKVGLWKIGIGSK